MRGEGGPSGTGLADLLRDTVSSEELYHKAMSRACGCWEDPASGEFGSVGPRRSWCEWDVLESIPKQRSQTPHRSCNYEEFHSTLEFNYNRFIPNVLH